MCEEGAARRGAEDTRQRTQGWRWRVASLDFARASRGETETYLMSSGMTERASLARVDAAEEEAGGAGGLSGRRWGEEGDDDGAWLEVRGAGMQRGRPEGSREGRCALCCASALESVGVGGEGGR